MGTFEAFEITIPQGQVKLRYGQFETKRLFHDDLGPELRNASDGCVRDPASCVPPGLDDSP